MTALIILNAFFAALAVGALVFLKRVAYKAALGHFDAPDVVPVHGEPQPLRRAA